MATRFGASGPAHSYAAKVRWLVGGLVAVIFVLGGTLFIIANSSTTTTPEQQGANVAVASPTPTSGVQILYASQRIEAGVQLMPQMFVEQDVNPDQIPEGAILARDKATLIGKYSKNLVQASQPLRRDDITDVQPISFITRNIPQGYRAVTITVDSRSGVEGWAQPNTRVDVLLSYVDKSGQKKVATVVPFSKILSVGGMTNTDAGSAGAQKKGDTTTVTLLVSELDAKKIELARSVGTLSLSLVGEQDPGTVRAPSDPIDISSLFPQSDRSDTPQAEPEPDGVMYVLDEKTGKQVRYVLQGRRWKKAEAGDQ